VIKILDNKDKDVMNKMNKRKYFQRSSWTKRMESIMLLQGQVSKEK
jgi:hypothetical protein